jgi:hypothetical protein
MLGLRSVLQTAAEGTARDCSYCELFAGEAAVSRGFAALGCTGCALDVRFSADHDLLSPTGFLTALRAVLRVQQGGLLWAAPPCSTWVWLSRASTGRDKRVEGDAHNDYVQGQNALVCRLVLLLRLCMRRGVYWIVEQPRSTLMFEYAPFKRPGGSGGTSVAWPRHAAVKSATAPVQYCIMRVRRKLRSEKGFDPPLPRELT